MLQSRNQMLQRRPHPTYNIYNNRKYRESHNNHYHHSQSEGESISKIIRQNLLFLAILSSNEVEVHQKAILMVQP